MGGGTACASIPRFLNMCVHFADRVPCSGLWWQAYTASWKVAPHFYRHYLWTTTLALSSIDHYSDHSFLDGAKCSTTSGSHGDGVYSHISFIWSCFLGCMLCCVEVHACDQNFCKPLILRLKGLQTEDINSSLKKYLFLENKPMALLGEKEQM